MRRNAAFEYALLAMAVLTGSTATLAGVRISGSGAPVASEARVRYSAGANHACQVRRDGSVACWGGNLSGQLGNGSTTNQSVPVTVSGVTGAVAVAAGLGHTCALLVGGAARCWGGNASGQLGDGTTTQRVTPVQVMVRTPLPFGGFLDSPLSNVVQLAAGYDHTCALIADGGVRCWGGNTFGQLGNGTRNDALRPIVVPSFTLNIDPSVSPKANGRVTTVNILAVCDDGRQLHVDVVLTQGPASGKGVGQGQCTGRLESYPVTVAAHGPDRFLYGPARVEAQAIIREQGAIVDEQQWARNVEIESTL